MAHRDDDEGFNFDDIEADPTADVPPASAVAALEVRIDECYRYMGEFKENHIVF